MTSTASRLYALVALALSCAASALATPTALQHAALTFNKDGVSSCVFVAG